MSSDIESELSNSDNGDDMQRRLDYQAAYAASKAIEMLNSDNGIECIYCELHQDILVKLTSKKFIAIQVKTRLVSSTSFLATDEEILSTIAHFVDLQRLYPNQIERFILASNHGFRQEQKPNCLPNIVALAKELKTEATTTAIKNYLKKINSYGAKNYSIQELIHVLAILLLDGEQPHFTDFKTVIASQIATSTPFAKLATQKELVNAAELLINKMRSLASLQLNRGFETFVKPDPEAAATQQVIQSKLATPEIVMAILNHTLDPEPRPSVDKLNKETSRGASTPSLTGEELKAAFAKQSRKLLAWPTTIDGQVRLESQELSRLGNTINTSNSSVQLLLGPPGAGKSALMAMLAKSFENPNVTLLALKADQLDASIDSGEKLTNLFGIGQTIQSAIETLAADSKVVILLDQLDSLADLVCLNTARLDMYLELIESLAGCHNVHIVATARIFEADHDPRLRLLEAIKVNLELPEWAEIAAYLESKNIHSGAWPADVKELFRTPQYLKIFVATYSTRSANIETTYRGLLNSLWGLHVDSEDGKKEALLDSIAERMGSREELSVPSVNFSTQRPIVNNLIATGILIEYESAGSLSFSHQTLFEYARARMFLRGVSSLSSYTLERQNSLFIRPQLWNALSYLRDGTRTQYRQEIDSILKCADLRFHIRLLIIEFLGHLADPEEFEIEWVIPYLAQDKYRKLVFHSVRNSRGWFEKLSEKYLPTYLQEQSTEACDVESLLRAAASFSGKAVFELLTQSWLARPDRDFATLKILEQLDEWPDNVHESICRIIRRNDVHPFFIDQLCSNERKISAKMAAEIILAQLQGQEDRAHQIEEKNLEQCDTPESEIFKEIKRNLECPRRKALIQILDSESLNGIESIIERDPEVFVKTIWPWFKHLVSSVLYTQEKRDSDYVNDGSYSILDDDESSSNSIVLIMDTAISAFALSSQQSFLEFLEENQESQSLLVHRLLARGLSKIARPDLQQAWDYLFGDRRRLALGDYQSDQLETVNLISSLVENASSQQVEKLCNYIEEYSYYSVSEKDSKNEDVELRFDKNKWNRHRRLILLRAIPNKYCSRKTLRQKQEEERVFPEKSAERTHGKVTRIESPMTIEQMSRASAEDLAHLFEELPDHSGNKHPRDWHKGGTNYASNNLRELAKTDHLKVIAIIELLKPGINEIPAGEAVIGLCLSGIEAEALFNIIRSMISRGFHSTSFKIAVADGIDIAVRRKIPIPETMVLYLEEFLESYCGGTPITVSSKSEAKPKSILWSSSGGEVYSSESTYKLVSTLTTIYLFREQPQWSKWLQLIENLAKRTDLRDMNQMWRMLAMKELPKLAHVDHNRASTLLEYLLSTSDSPLISWAGAQLFTATHFWLPESTVRKWLSSFLTGDWEDSKQAYGELLLLHHITFPGREWSKLYIDDLLVEKSSIANLQIVQGVAFALGHLWTSTMPYLTKLVNRVLGVTHIDARTALAEGLSSIELFADSASQDLLKTLCNDHELLKKIDAYTLLDNCLQLTTWYPEQVFVVCMQLVEEYGKEIKDLRTSRIELAGPLVDIAIRLQRLNEPARSWGLELFELLIRHDVPDAKALLSALDRRIDSSSRVPQIALPRRRRRRRRSKGRRI